MIAAQGSTSSPARPESCSCVIAAGDAVVPSRPRNSARSVVNERGRRLTSAKATLPANSPAQALGGEQRARLRVGRADDLQRRLIALDSNHPLGVERCRQSSSAGRLVFLMRRWNSLTGALGETRTSKSCSSWWLAARESAISLTVTDDRGRLAPQGAGVHVQNSPVSSSRR